MEPLHITILDPDTGLAEKAARRLRAHMKKHGVQACVQEVTCYLEISRQGLQGKTPVIAVDGSFFQCKNLEDDLLAQFADWLTTDVLAQKQGQPSGQQQGQSE
ncbi:MAG: hypothetical protein ACNI3A_08790 [Desulfovibrio sp.]|uniref:hypothetical protein n=1 Tax=Desulfovibrio sp. 7SRBS1 TaxID=3378064 RepID=UPI003B3E0A9B